MDRNLERASQLAERLKQHRMWFEDGILIEVLVMRIVALERQLQVEREGYAKEAANARTDRAE